MLLATLQGLGYDLTNVWEWYGMDGAIVRPIERGCAHWMCKYQQYVDVFRIRSGDRPHGHTEPS